MSKPVFKAEINPMNDNETIIYEMSVSRYNYRFAVDKANFENDHDFEDFIKYLVENLNKPKLYNFG